jgi:hypothetical protein
MLVRNDCSCSSGVPVVELLFARVGLDQLRHFVLNVIAGSLHRIKLRSHAAQKKTEQMNSSTHNKENKRRRRRSEEEEEEEEEEAAEKKEEQQQH